ncbi:hypothetical protein P5673_017486 [Acropora cervicornis]|uniref:Uncharacterized protein n=1 Tax=Acropora cervicornis TaxID=6130 RepID=A0AAD9QER5_ACRCE|nr:hypothetical protein P5673_017486 [Acropora cervicornis]
MEGIGLNTTVKFIINLECFQCNIYGETRQNCSQTTKIGELIFFSDHLKPSTSFPRSNHVFGDRNTAGHRLLLNDDDGNHTQHNNQSQQFASIFGMPYPRRFHGNPATAATHSQLYPVSLKSDDSSLFVFGQLLPYCFCDATKGYGASFSDIL